MTLFKKLFVLLAIAVVTGPLACTEESAKNSEEEQSNPALTELFRSIELIELEKARGNTLVSITPETNILFKRVLERAKAAVNLLFRDSESLEGLTELVRSRDEFRNILMLSEDNDIVGVFRTALENAVREMSIVQKRNAFELGDPNSYRELFSQSFGLRQKLGDFMSFVEIKTSRGPKLFEEGTCGDVCRNLEYIISDVNKNQAVWLVSPKLSLPESSELKLTFSGSSRGDVNTGGVKGLKVYVSESFNGAFTNTDDQWTEITSLMDRYPTNGTAFRSFTSTLWLDKFRGKSVAFAIRVQGLTNATTAYQFQSFAVMGKGLSTKTNLTLTAPEPLLLADTDTIPAPTRPNPGNAGNGPILLPPSANKSSGFADCVANADGSIEVTSSCRIALDSQAAYDKLIVYDSNTAPNAASPFRKFSKGLPTTKASGWKFGNCFTKPKVASLSGFCVDRSAKDSYDLLVGPKLKVAGDVTVKIYYSIIGSTLNDLDNDGKGDSGNNRFRALAISEVVYDEVGKKLDIIDLAGTAAGFNPALTNNDLLFANYPGSLFVTDEQAIESEMLIDTTSLSARIGTSSSAFRLALLLNLAGTAFPAPSNATAWYVYEIAFEKKN